MNKLKQEGGWLNDMGTWRIAGPTKYDTGDNPAMIVNRAGSRMIDIHTGGLWDNLWHHFLSWDLATKKVGDLQTNGERLDDSAASDHPLLARYENTLVIVHECGSSLCSRAGKTFSTPDNISWAATSKSIGSGSNPSVIVQGSNVLLMFNDGSKLYTRFGTVSYTYLTVTWHDSRKEIPDSWGKYPSFAMVDSRRLMLVHTGGGTGEEDLYMRFGTVDWAGRKVTWVQGPVCQDNPSIRYLNSGAEAPSLQFLGYNTTTEEYLFLEMHMRDGNQYYHKFWATDSDWLDPINRLAKVKAQPDALSSSNYINGDKFGSATCNGAWYKCHKKFRDILFP